jgi:hypothetical protein
VGIGDIGGIWGDRGHKGNLAVVGVSIDRFSIDFWLQRVTFLKGRCTVCAVGFAGMLTNNRTRTHAVERDWESPPTPRLWRVR